LEAARIIKMDPAAEITKDPIFHFSKEKRTFYE